MKRSIVSSLCGSRSLAVSVGTMLISINIAPGVFVTAAASEALAPAAEIYATCVEQAAPRFAREHVRDQEVWGSSIPEKTLSLLVNNYLEKMCTPLFESALRSDNGDGMRAAERGYVATKTAIRVALAGATPPPRPTAPGIDDYEHGEKLNNGAWEYLSTECQAVLDWDKYAVPASCKQEVRKANRLYQEDNDRKEEQLLATPTVRYCLGLRLLDEVASEPPRIASGNKFDAILTEGFEDNRKLQAALDDRSEKLANCLNRIRTAGGLVFVDPKHEMDRVNRIPEVK